MKRTFEKYCKDYENIENYEAAKKCNFKGWNCHHRLETHNSDGLRRPVDITKEELIALNMYYNRPASELIFLTASEHHILHKKGKPRTEETRKKIGEGNRGKQLTDEIRKKISEAMKGKPKSEEHKRKIGEAQKGKQLTEETKHKMSLAQIGKRLSDKTRRKISEAKKNISDETRKKLSEAKKGKPSNVKGMRWFNNGKINTMAKECPDGFVPGRY